MKSTIRLVTLALIATLSLAGCTFHFSSTPSTPTTSVAASEQVEPPVDENDVFHPDTSDCRSDLRSYRGHIDSFSSCIRSIADELERRNIPVPLQPPGGQSVNNEEFATSPCQEDLTYPSLSNEDLGRCFYMSMIWLATNARA